MDNASLQFVLFGLIAAVISNISRSPAWRSLVLTLASLTFVGILARDPLRLLPLVGFLLLGYAGLILLQRGWPKFTIWSILLIIIAYVWLKKYTFLPEGVLIHFPYFTLGLSYIFFRVLHLLIEAGHGEEKKHISPAAYLLYTLNFTTLISGPIQPYEDFARDQFDGEPIALGPRIVGLQLERIIRGFFKVNILALLLNAAKEDALGQMHPTFPLSIKLFAAFKLSVVYPLYLYCNFSGYIDIVISLARLMRIRLPENFDRPFSATSFIDFWTRWHITLSTWLKTYVYNPLLTVLMRRIPSETLQPLLGVSCFFVTFLLIGIWHGRTKEFFAYGFLLGVGAAINKLWQLGLTRSLGRKGYKELAKNPVYEMFARGLTFSWFAFSLFWFWADSKRLGAIFAALSAKEWVRVWLAVWMCASVLLASWEWLRARILSIRIGSGPILTCRYARVATATVLVVVAVAITYVLNQPAPGLVYKAF